MAFRNISTAAKYLQRVSNMSQWLEMEIGITGLFSFHVAANWRQEG